MQKCKFKFIRFISYLTLITAMIFASSVPSLAAGREDWVPETFAFSRTIKTKRPLRYNERIELFTDVCSAGSAPDPYRKAHIEYRYRFK